MKSNKKMILRKELLLLTVLLFQYSFSQEYSLENKIFNCIKERFKTKNIDIEEDILKYESFLVKSQYLKDNTGISYIEAYKKMADAGTLLFPPVSPEIQLDNLINHSDLFQINPCVSDSEAGLLKNAKISDFAQSRDDVSPKEIFNYILQTFSDKDFDNLYYKYIFLTAITATREYLNIDDNTLEIKKRNIVDIFIDDNDKIYINNEHVKKRKFKSKLLVYIRGSKTDERLPKIETKTIDLLGEAPVSQCVIQQELIVNNDREIFEFVRINILDAFDIVKQEKARELFGKNLQSLDAQERFIIDQVVPYNQLFNRITFE